MLVTLLLACSPPPPAPEGLDAATSYMVREFYSDDATFGAGVQGFMDWFNTEGAELVGQEATADNTDTFTLSDLSTDDVALLPLADDGRDMSMAKGVISLAEMDCTWEETEAYLVRPDQDTIFSGDWEGYERTYLSSRDTFEQAGIDSDFVAIEAAIDPFADGFDLESLGKSLLRTENMVDPSSVLFADLPAYEMNLDLRHGSFEIDGEALRVMSILTWNDEAVWDEGENNGLRQSYSVELNIEREGGRTLRALAVWAEPVGAGLEPDSSLVLNYAVNKSLESSQQISGVCAGEIEIE